MDDKKRKTLVVDTTVRLICHRERWRAWASDCGKILSIQNCQNFFGKNQVCDCFEIQEKEIRQRELDKVREMIQKTAEESPDEKRKNK